MEKDKVTTFKKLKEVSLAETIKLREKRNIKVSGDGVPELKTYYGETFLCLACFEDLPVDKKSEDKRFCKECYNFLKEEYRKREAIKEQKLEHDKQFKKDAPEPVEKENKKEKRKVKRGEALELVKKFGTGYKTESKDGHYAVIQVATNKKVTKKDLPIIPLPEFSTETHKTVTKETTPQKTPHKKIHVIDKVKNVTYKNRFKAYIALLDGGELDDLMAAGKLGKDPRNFTFGWYTIARRFPDRFELVED